ncbi:hypothetical protein BC826DRAFT_1021694 [Russula brevipes]|nr:hypothetical protein BC826DRAFT_1021694 [Russula brevipes]
MHQRHFFSRAHPFSHLWYSRLMGDQAAPQYFSDVSHASPLSSKVSACSVEPGSAEDLSKIVRCPSITGFC